MRNSPQAISLAALACCLFMLAACSKTDLADGNEQFSYSAKAGTNQTTYYGPVVQIGNGHIRSFGVLEHGTSKPLQVGFEMTAGSLQNLPEHGHEHYTVKLHPQVQAATVFDHLVADWNPQGHGPDPYLSAHFDMHFYILSLAQRLQISAGDPLSVAPLPAGFLPADYIGPLGPEPQMGGHCVDITSPELGVFGPPQPFTHTFIYGAYNSKVAFYEPMITRDYLQNSAGGTFNIKQPANFSAPGYYPTKYSISTDASGKRFVVLSDFVYRN